MLACFARPGHVQHLRRTSDGYLSPSACGLLCMGNLRWDFMGRGLQSRHIQAGVSQAPRDKESPLSASSPFSLSTKHQPTQAIKSSPLTTRIFAQLNTRARSKGVDMGACGDLFPTLCSGAARLETSRSRGRCVPGNEMSDQSLPLHQTGQVLGLTTPASGLDGGRRVSPRLSLDWPLCLPAAEPERQPYHITRSPSCRRAVLQKQSTLPDGHFAACRGETCG